MPKVKFDIDFSIVECARCSMPFAIISRFEKDRREDHAPFYCPAGHTNVYNHGTALDIAKERIDRLEERITELLSDSDEPTKEIGSGEVIQ